MPNLPVETQFNISAGNPDHRIGNSKQEDLRYTLTYADPTGEEAIRRAADQLSNQLGWDRRSDFKLTVTGDSIPASNGKMLRPKIPVHIDDELASVVMQVLAQVADFQQTRSGLGFRASLKKEKTPEFVKLFGDKNEYEGSEQKHHSKGVFRV